MNLHEVKSKAVFSVLFPLIIKGVLSILALLIH